MILFIVSGMMAAVYVLGVMEAAFNDKFPTCKGMEEGLLIKLILPLLVIVMGWLGALAMLGCLLFDKEMRPHVNLMEWEKFW